MQHYNSINPKQLCRQELLLLLLWWAAAALAPAWESNVSSKGSCDRTRRTREGQEEKERTKRKQAEKGWRWASSRAKLEEGQEEDNRQTRRGQQEDNTQTQRSPARPATVASFSLKNEANNPNRFSIVYILCQLLELQSWW